MSRRYRYRFDTIGQWLPVADRRREMTYQMMAVAPAAEIVWDPGGTHPPGVDITMPLEGRLPLEGLALIVQALNTAFVHVADWPPQMQSCVATDIGGAHPPAVAVGSVECVEMRPVTPA